MTKIEYREKQRSEIIDDLRLQLFVNEQIKSSHERILFMICHNIYRYDSDERLLSREQVECVISSLKDSIECNKINIDYLLNLDLNTIADNSIIDLPYQTCFAQLYPSLQGQVL